MRIVDVIEGSEAWRSWRAGGIGSSDAPILCGVSRYQEIGALWQSKRARSIAAPPDDLRLARGRALEPKARRAVAERLGVTLSPRCVEHDTHPTLRASLDAWSDDPPLPVEIKCTSRALHAEALAGRLPRRFAPQLLHILVVTGASRVLYASYQPDGVPAERALALLEIPRDPSLCEQLQRLELAFWRAVVDGTTARVVTLPLAGLAVRKVD